MHEFPFSSDEWDAVSEYTNAVLNATLMDDEILRASKFVELQELLGAMRAKYGDHPVLLETEADFCNESETRLLLYEAALEIAALEKLPAYTIHLELAQMRFEQGELTAALAHLDACEVEISKVADDFDRSRWRELRKAITNA